MDSVKSHQISNQDKLSKHIEKWYILKQDIAELEKKMEYHKDRVKKYMKESNLSSTSSNSIIVESRTSSMSRISKDNVPQHVWNQYAKTSSFDVYTVRKIGDKRSRSRSLSRSRSTSRSRSRPTSPSWSRPTSPRNSNRVTY